MGPELSPSRWNRCQISQSRIFHIFSRCIMPSVDFKRGFCACDPRLRLSKDALKLTELLAAHDKGATCLLLRCSQLYFDQARISQFRFSFGLDIDHLAVRYQKKKKK